MSSDRRKNRLLLDNDIQEIENMQTIFEFQVQICSDSTQYKSPEYVLRGTDLHCYVKLKVTGLYVMTFFLKIKDDYKNFCVDKPRFKEILCFTRRNHFLDRVTINEENPTLSIKRYYGNIPDIGSFKVTVTYTIKCYEIITDENLTMLFNLQNMYEDKKFTDLKINVEGEEFLAHKALLIGNPVFAAILRNDMQESNENIIYIKEMDPAVFQIILRYLYLGDTGNINFKKHGVDFLINLIVATDMYQMGYLNTELIKVAIRYINLRNVIKLFILADRFSILQLKRKIMLYIRNHRKEIWDSLPFKELIKKNQKLTGELLSYIMEHGLP
ncbi:PREDICTED: ankyrin repeat and BTB/POZ domain-containing protein BTBD11-B-like [Polistes canadensis]|uniref:ankyrin repeat and BTB/POZ domain-containing protein BTBD11-B-like n=1 Tax=Polistes canadensis TaxID=91411 RepID=UPI000718C9C7|nr:PREDICTED: ankyrin repeat and BTB/POZ domain-containing protein BTBD11-B-like [Polistes canadensis]